MLVDPHVALILTALWFASLFLFVPAVVALLVMRRRGLDPVTQVLWVGAILCFPFFGALAFFLLRPSAPVRPIPNR